MAKIYKIYAFSFCLVFLLFCTSFSKQKKETVDIIYIYSTEFSTRTITRVECDNFFQAFRSDIDSFDASKDKNKIIEMLYGIKKDTSIESHVDTRAKMYIYYASGKIDEYCFGNFTH